jgi:catechol 2,3-dioxygenase-like lactoylglutathione lyase family enzyme
VSSLAARAIRIFVTDLAEAVGFYRDTLGLPLTAARSRS